MTPQVPQDPSDRVNFWGTVTGPVVRFHPVLRRGCDPLRLELLACEFLGGLGVPAPGPEETDGALSQSSAMLPIPAAPASAVPVRHPRPAAVGREDEPTGASLSTATARRPIAVGTLRA